MTFHWPKNAVKSKEEFYAVGIHKIWWVDWDGNVEQWTKRWKFNPPVDDWFFEDDRNPYVFLFGNYWDAYAHALRTRKEKNEPEAGA